MNEHDPRNRFLTHTDLEQLEIPAERIDQWLDEGSLEQLTLLQFDDGSDPVYAVHSPELIEVFEQGLQTIDRPGVIMDPGQAQAELARCLEGPEFEAFVAAQTSAQAADTADPVPTSAHEVAASLTGTQQDGRWCELPSLAEDDLFRHVTAEDTVGPQLLGTDQTESGAEHVAGTTNPSRVFDDSSNILSDVQSALDSLLSQDEQQHIHDDQLTALMADQSAEAPPADTAKSNARNPNEEQVGNPSEDESTANILFRPSPGQSLQGQTDPEPASGAAFDLEPLAEPLRQIDLTVRMLAERSVSQPDISKLIETVENGFDSLLEALPETASLQSIDNQLQEVRASVDRLNAADRRRAPTGTGRMQPRPRRQRAARRVASNTGGSHRKLLAATLMLMGWVGLLWSHSVNTKFAAVTFVAANVLGCLLLTARTGRRS